MSETWLMSSAYPPALLGLFNWLSAINCLDSLS